MVTRAAPALFLAVVACAPGRTENLLANPGAEEGTSSTTGASVSVPGWTVSEGATVVSYGSPDYPALDGPGPGDRGEHFFSGGNASARSALRQSLDVARYASGIDAGAATVELSGWLGGYLDQDDEASVALVFRSETAILGSFTLEGVRASDREDTTGLLYRSASTPVPVGTRDIQVEVRFVLAAGLQNDACADELALVLVGI